ncbi:hypothetical protein OUZ56_003411 [Daphnia magna]|uniref:Uncharacterized protein n=1 Tax=Daphnia magna TaxID=35525 RepID=A0ABR0A8L9_9CRUS|nr:hypothetical protein OUZ56_003411 [Daphnia magna]
MVRKPFDNQYETLLQTNIHKRSLAQKTLNSQRGSSTPPSVTMATPFFEDDWETLSKEDLAACRAKLLGFTEGVPDSNNELKEVQQA